MRTTTFIKALALAAAFGATTVAASAQSAQTITSAVPSAQLRSDQQSISVGPSVVAAANEAIRDQQQLHVQVPALSGDGGG